MAICKMQARWIVKEHLKESLEGKKIVTLGRQSIWMNLEEALEICKEEGYFPNKAFIDRANEITLTEEDNTRCAGQINDNAFFALFGAESVDSIDHSGYENATIVHNLNLRIPEELEEKFDYLIDGGTFDHIFDIREAFENMTKLLKRGGRIFVYNAATNYISETYCMFSPKIYADYFAINNYDSCAVYICECETIRTEDGTSMIYEFDASKKDAEEFSTDKRCMIFAFAKKRSDGLTTFHLMPIDSNYRTKDQMERYKINHYLIEVPRVLDCQEPEKRKGYHFIGKM